MQNRSASGQNTNSSDKSIAFTVISRLIIFGVVSGALLGMIKLAEHYNYI